MTRELTEATLRELYVEQQMSLAQVAARLGTHAMMVRRAMDRLGIPRRDPVEATALARQQKGYVMVPVVSQEEVQIGVLADGLTPDVILMDVLECGHRVPVSIQWLVTTVEGHPRVRRDLKTRHCPSCKKEA